MNLKNIKFAETAVPKGKRALLKFGDTKKLSIIQNEFSYGGDKGLYEIAVFDGADQVEMPGITAEGDTVKGFLTESDVDVIIKKMLTVTGSEPVQIV